MVAKGSLQEISGSTISQGSELYDLVQVQFADRDFCTKEITVEHVEHNTGIVQLDLMPVGR